MNEKERLKEIIHILRKSNILSGITPEKFYNIIEDLGPTFIKIGQIMSNREDILPKEYCAYLSKLRSNVKPVPFLEIQEILREEYGDYDEIFSYINPKCIGSASIAQVHKARLTTGETVVIKVQRKNIYDKMSMDVKLLKKAISLLHLNNIFKVIDLTEVIDQMYNVAKEEMNFEIEAKHIKEFNDNNKDIVYVRAPHIYENLTTTKILVMEYIDGITINDIKKLTNKGYDLNEIGLKLANNYIKQAIDDGFFHADPHPDNIIISDGKIVFIDLGMMGRVSLRDRTLLKKCMFAIVKNDIYEVEKILLNLSVSEGEINHIKLRQDIESILSKNTTLELKNIDTVSFINSVFKMLQENNIKLNKNITILIRGIGIIEGVLEEISPEINLFEVLSNKLKEETINDIFTKENLMKVGQNIINVGDSVLKIPNEALKLVTSINRGETSFKMELNDYNKIVNKLEKMLHMIIIGFLDAGLFLASSIVDSIILRNIYMVWAFILAAWLFIKMYLDHINKS